MSELRYKILNESISAHCCFEYTVVDTSIIDEYGDFQTMCETFEKDEAEIICTALNFLEATQQEIQKQIEPNCGPRDPNIKSITIFDPSTGKTYTPENEA